MARKTWIAGIAVLTACFFGLLLMILMNDRAYAEITATAGEVHEAPPPASVMLNNHEHADTGPQPSGVHAFEEEQDYVTKAPILLDVCTTNTSSFVICPNPKSGNIDRTSSLSPGTIPAGTCIDSHFLHADPPGSTGPVQTYGGLTGNTHHVTFDSPILGVILLSTSLTASDVDPGLGPTTVLYGGEAQRGLEFNASGTQDGIRLSVVQNELTRLHFKFDAGAVDLDQIRVITLGDADECPGQAKTLTLTPDAASNEVNTTHCVMATAETETGGPAQGVIVRFDVEGASEQDQNPADEDASKTTDQNGEALHCYKGPETVGIDTIHAYADNDNDGVEDLGTDPSDEATKTWLPAEGKSVTLEPPADENPVNTQHCVTATVRDLFGNRVPGETVRFVVTGTTTKGGVDQTNEIGVAEFCYTSTKAGADVIEAFVDDDNDKTRDADEPFNLAGKVWQPGQPATVLLEPKAASNEIQTQHCVTASVRDAFQNPVPNVTVRFVVTGVNTKSGADNTDAGGQAVFCYTGGTTAGADEITAYADSDNDQTRDVPLEPGDFAAKTWLPAEPAFLTLTPKTAQNPVTNDPDKAHCVQAHVTDAFLNPNPNETVHFIVTDAVPPGGPVEKQGSDVTDEGGIAEFCYTSTEAGLDAIHAFVDSIDPPVGQSGQQDPGEPFDDATKLWQPGDPATLVLTPETSTNEVETQHCVKAEVRDAFGNPTPNELVRFDVEGASEQDQDPADEDGSDTTDEFGNAEHCYTGPDLPGADTIHAYADNNENNVEDANEPARDTVTKTWVLPPSTPGCEVTIHDGGWIETLTDSKGTFGGNARIEADGAITRGELSYQDHSTLTPITFHSIEVLRIVCRSEQTGGQSADIYGTGKVNGLGPVDFRVRVSDRGEPGSAPGPDTYQIITAAYTSGPEENPLQGGNIQIHRF
jgi:hypothetical protein